MEDLPVAWEYEIMSNVNVANGAERLKAHMEKRGIDPLDPRDDLPVRADRLKAVPVGGSVHVAIGKTASRKDTDEKFRSLRFS